MLIAALAVMVVVIVHVGLRHQLPAFPADATIYDLAVTLPASLLGVWAIWLLYVRTRATERNTAAALEAVRNGQLALEQSRTTELAGRFEKGLQLIDREGISACIGGVLILRDVGRAAPSLYGDHVLRTLSSYMARATSASWEEQRQYYTGGSKTRAEMPIGRFVAEPPPPGGITPDDVCLALEAFSEVLESMAQQNVPARGASLSRVAIWTDRRRLPAYFAGVHFEECFFHGAIFLEGNLEGTRFVACRLDTAQFVDCELSGAVFNLPGADRGHLSHNIVRFAQCDLARATFACENIEFIECDLTQCTLLQNPLPAIEACWYLDNLRPTGFPELPAAKLFSTRRAKPGPITSRGFETQSFTA
ncbi:pentapeptide repeat-containing protein [Pelagibacterium montanilacus]|uniref:pentapeptide repeat-containing protein n=1 Tax=Pelagibacterium montanilacus TaxID=2185280 RepID=UPI001FEB2F14|nr:pentapeptide repeat-containing protein [Pelagibacterium montanilacus]